MNKYKLVWIVLCWNESYSIPYVADYWNKIINDGVELKVVVYDNHSTDGSVELLSKYDFVEIRYFESDGMNDLIQCKIKNNAWKEFKNDCDYVIVSDFDELLYFKDIKSTLEKMKKGGYNVLGTKWYMMCSDKEPVYAEGKLLHELCPKVCYQSINVNRDDLGKYMLIDPKLIDDMRWSVGNHISYPIPYIKLLEVKPTEAFELHINKGYSEQYFVERRQYMNKRLSETNKKHGFCFEYAFPEEIIREEYKNNQAKSFNIIDKINGVE